MGTKRKSSALLLVTMIAFGTWLPGYGQDLYRFQNYTSKEGLPSEFFNGLVQDSLGFIWINYASGLARFDGYTFRAYVHDVEDTMRSPGLGTMGYFFQDNFDNFWIRPHGLKDADLLLTRYDSRKDRFVKVHVDVRDSIVSRYCFDRDDRNVLWLGTYGRGICRVDMKSKSIEQFAVSQCSSSDKKLCNWVRGVWDCGTFLNVATLNGMWRFDKRSKTFSRPACDPKDTVLFYHSNINIRRACEQKQAWLAIDHPDEKEPGVILALVTPDLSIIKQFTLPEGLTPPLLDCDATDFVWRVPEEGVTRHNIKDGSMELIRYPTPNLLAKGEVTAFTLDNQKNLWVGTNKGISRISKTSLEFHNTPLNGIGSACVYAPPGTNKEYLIFSLSSVVKGNYSSDIIIAPIENDHLDKTRFQNLASIKSEAVSSIAMGKRMLWLAAPGEAVIGLPIDDKSGLPSSKPAVVYAHSDSNPNTVSSFIGTSVWEDPNENLWVTTKAGGLNKIVRSIPYGEEGSVIRYKHDALDSNSLGDDIVYNVFPADDKSLWLITDTGIDLFQNALLQTATQKFEHVFKNKGSPTDFIITSDSTMFVGTYRGLFEAKLNAKDHAFRKVKELSNLEIGSIKQDSLGRLWIFNNGGAVCFDRNKRTTTTFDEDDGIIYTQISGGGPHKLRTSTGSLVLLGDDGITIFDPLTLIVDGFRPQPQLTRLSINNKEARAGQAFDESAFIIREDIAVTGDLTLDYRHNNFSLEFSAMEMTDPEKNRYRHRLEGYDPDWIETDYKNRTATYTNLDAGTYTFRVKASNHQGIWGDKERTLKVIILPPPWKTAWAYTGYALIVVGLLFMARRMIVQRERLKGSLKLEKVEREKEHFELEKAKEVDRVKTSFFTNISHEFRTPLTLIKGPVETLLDRFKDDSDAVQRLKLVQRNSDVLLRLINQLLDLAKLESGTMKIEKSNSDINSFIRAIAGSFESLARHKNVTLSVEISSDRQQVVFDKDKLETILINLINNAIKFTPSGGNVYVQAACSNNSLTMIVRDTGIGIPVEHQQKVFERFHQVSEAHKEIGTGIGLSLVKELIQLLEGTIAVNSEPGRGTTFTVTIPVEAGTEATDTPEKLVAPLSIDNGHFNNEFHIQPSHNGALELPHVLVVEDNDDLRAFIIDSLGQEFYFLEADNGRTGLEVATTDIPDLIISDVMMPEMDGITMAGKIKADHRSSHIPLILLTAKSTEDSKLQGLKSGADDYLTKPFNTEELLLKVRNSISRQIKLRERLRAEVMGSAPTVEVMSEDERFLVNVKEKILERLSDEQLSVESLAEDIGISRVHLYRKVSGLTGLSVNELIRKLRLQRAAQLIGQRWGPVSQVAYEVGFSNLSYFSKVFREEYGVLPSEYGERN